MISLVMATYNGEKYVGQQLESILKQTCPPDEIIICDDNSSDKTLEVVESELKNWPGKSVIIKHDNNCGVVRSFEDACNASEGDFIFFSDQDDYWQNNKIEKTLAAFSLYDARLVFTNASITDESLKKTGRNLWQSIGFTVKHNKGMAVYSKQELISEIVMHNIVTGMTMACTRKMLEESLPFPDYPLHDYWITLNAAFNGTIVAIDDETVLYRQHASNVVGAGKTFFSRDLRVVKKHYLNTLEKQLRLSELFFHISQNSDITSNNRNFINNNLIFNNLRYKALHDRKGLIKLLALKRDYKKYSLPAQRLFKKDVFYELCLKRIIISK